MLSFVFCFSLNFSISPSAEHYFSLLRNKYIVEAYAVLQKHQTISRFLNTFINLIEGETENVTLIFSSSLIAKQDRSHPVFVDIIDHVTTHGYEIIAFRMTWLQKHQAQFVSSLLSQQITDTVSVVNYEQNF